MSEQNEKMLQARSPSVTGNTGGVSPRTEDSMYKFTTNIIEWRYEKINYHNIHFLMAHSDFYGQYFRVTRSGSWCSTISNIAPVKVKCNRGNTQVVNIPTELLKETGKNKGLEA